MQLMARTAAREPLRAVIQPETILEMRALVDAVHVDEQIEDYIVRLVFATREPGRFVPKMEGMIRFGASPRASINLALAGESPRVPPRPRLRHSAGCERASPSTCSVTASSRLLKQMRTK